MPVTLTSAELAQAKIEERVFEWTELLCEALEANYDKGYPNSSDPVRFSIESGRKYWKIMQNQGGVHAFIDKKTGQVYKPASCLLYTSPSPRDGLLSRMPSSA